MRSRFALAALAALAFAPAAHAQLGVAVGANFDRVSDIEGNTQATFNNASGYHVGVFLDLPLGPIALRPGVFYTDISNIEATRAGKTESYDISLVEIPVDVRFRLPLPIAKPYLLGGPVFRIANQDDENFRLNRFTMAGAAGAGLELNAFVFRPFIEARYQFGVQKFVDDFSVGGVSVQTEDNTKLNTFMLRLGVTF